MKFWTLKFWKIGLLLMAATLVAVLVGCGSSKNAGPDANNFVGPDANNLQTNSTAFWEGRLSIANGGVYKRFLIEYARACDQTKWANDQNPNTLWHYTYEGPATNCKSWRVNPYVGFQLNHKDTTHWGAEGYMSTFYINVYRKDGFHKTAKNLKGVIVPAQENTMYQFLTQQAYHSSTYTLGAEIRIDILTNDLNTPRNSPKFTIKFYYRGTLIMQGPVYLRQ